MCICVCVCMTFALECRSKDLTKNDILFHFCMYLYALCFAAICFFFGFGLHLSHPDFANMNCIALFEYFYSPTENRILVFFKAGPRSFRFPQYNFAKTQCILLFLYYMFSLYNTERLFLIFPPVMAGPETFHSPQRNSARILCCLVLVYMYILFTELRDCIFVTKFPRHGRSRDVSFSAAQFRERTVY